MKFTTNEPKKETPVRLRVTSDGRAVLSAFCEGKDIPIVLLESDGTANVVGVTGTDAAILARAGFRVCNVPDALPFDSPKRVEARTGAYRLLAHRSEATP